MHERTQEYSQWECIGVLRHIQRYFSYIYVTAQMCRRTEAEEIGPTVGLPTPSYRHFVGFFNVPVQAPTRGYPLDGYFEKPPHLVAF